MSSDKDNEATERLLAHIRTADTLWFKISMVLLDFAVRGVPETRNSYNPIKYIAGMIGVWMETRQTKRTNKKFDKRSKG